MTLRTFWPLQQLKNETNIPIICKGLGNIGIQHKQYAINIIIVIIVIIIVKTVQKVYYGAKATRSISINNINKFSFQW